MTERERYSHPEKLEITESIFEDMEDKDIFCQNIRKYYHYVLYPTGYEPIINESRLQDAWRTYRRDKKHLPNSMPKNNTPDHFKLSGILVYWLRRFAPVYDLHDLSMVCDKKPELMKLAKNYPSEFPAFDFGVSVCDFFVSNSKTSKGKPQIDIDYYNFICYVMKFKNLSPHSLGAIYRSLFTPLHND